MSEPYTPVLRLPRGKGRDFVVSDIHGMFHLVMKAMEELQFDPSVDRLFSVGDTVDRGPFSAAARQFLREHWVKAVRGNHEGMFLDCYQGGQLDLAALKFNVERNGADWWLEISDEERWELLSIFAQMPLAIEVETSRGLVGLVHAEVPRGMDWQTFCALLEAGDPHTCASALWGRTRVTANDRSGVPGVDRIYSGHTIHGQVQRLGNCFMLDTGAFLSAEEEGGRLTVANMVAATTPLLARPNAQQKHSSLQLFGETSRTPFSAYLNKLWG